MKDNIYSGIHLRQHCLKRFAVLDVDVYFAVLT